MSSPAPIHARKVQAQSMADDAAGSLDVGWLLHPKKDRGNRPDLQPQSKPDGDSQAPLNHEPDSIAPDGVPGASPDTGAKTVSAPPSAQLNDSKTATATASATTVKAVAPAAAPPPAAQPNTGPARSTGPRGPVNDENKPPAAVAKGPVSNLKNQGGRRSSWISNISSKFSSTPAPAPSRSASLDAQTAPEPGPASPKLEFGNPFNKKEAKKEGKKETKEEEPRPVITYTPRRQSVLVHAGQERKLDSPGFLSSALRRLSSSNNATLGKGAGTGAAGQRRVMNVDHNRERVKISEFDQNKLRRVAFCVDVEIAGYGAQAEEEHEHPPAKPPTSLAGQRQGLATIDKQLQADKKDSKAAKYKDQGEGAALRNPQAAEEKDNLGITKADAQIAAAEEVIEKKKAEEAPEPGAAEVPSQPQAIPTTRKKEKKKRSEAERKERRERKRRQAEANGLVPLELSGVHDDDSDSSPNATPPGASTPSLRNGDSPTTDPLRIYKRCCQLRETSVLDRVREQISKPAATLAEAPGTVAVIDLSGTQMPLQDITTLGDWLAVVPVRKLILDDCALTDEALRVILSGLTGCKSAEQARMNRKLPRKIAGKPGREQMGVIEKLSLKNNTQITNIGWKHIALFLHISRSLKAVDLSGIPFPKRSQDYMTGVLSRTSTASSTNTNGTATPEPKYGDIGSLIAKALSERFGDRLEELILSRCSLAASNIGDIIDCAIKRRIRRLGLAENNITPEGLEHIVRYVKSGACEGLDLGGNNLHGVGHLVANAVDESNPLFAISLADCSLTPSDLGSILPPFTKLKNFKFIDLSRNRDLFSSEPTAVPCFRKMLPRLKALRRIHLADVDMTSEHVIALAEMLPDCPELAHVSILDNPALIKAMNSTEGSAQEEACAFLASLMTAVRVSHTIIAIELEVPSSDSSEVVKALASQIVAYSLRNMEYSALDEVGVDAPHKMPNKDAPEVLLHIVGHMEGYDENHDNDEPAPDEDYMIASTGIVKALGVCLGTNDSHSRTHSRNMTPTGSGTVTPRQGPARLDASRNLGKKPKNVSLQLCESARKIRMRLRPALVKEDRAGNDYQYRRLSLLDQTLERIIQRFEDEYPETKLPPSHSSPPTSNGVTSGGSSLADSSLLSASVDSNSLSKIPSSEEYMEGEGEGEEDRDREPYAIKLSRTSSNTSLAAKALTSEEGRMHRLGQTFRREVLKPTQMDDYEHGTNVNDEPEPAHMAVLRSRLEELGGNELRERIVREGPDKVIQEMKFSMHELRALEEEDPSAFEKFKESQVAAKINSQV